MFNQAHQKIGRKNKIRRSKYQQQGCLLFHVRGRLGYSSGDTCRLLRYPTCLKRPKGCPVFSKQHRGYLIAKYTQVFMGQKKDRRSGLKTTQCENLPNTPYRLRMWLFAEIGMRRFSEASCPTRTNRSASMYSYILRALRLEGCPELSCSSPYRGCRSQGCHRQYRRRRLTKGAAFPFPLRCRGDTRSTHVAPVGAAGPRLGLARATRSLDFADLWLGGVVSNPLLGRPLVLVALEPAEPTTDRKTDRHVQRETFRVPGARQDKTLDSKSRLTPAPSKRAKPHQMNAGQHERPDRQRGPAVLE